MRRVLHLSDLHFGRLHPPALESLRHFLHAQEQNLDLIVITGDWTQRARKSQFLEAGEFLDSVRVPVVTVPGNHDVPLYNLWARFLSPFKKYQKYIGQKTYREYSDECVAIAGISTVDIYTPIEGKVHAHELNRARDFFNAQSPTVLRLLAGHHPLPRKELEFVGADVVLTGHSHAAEVERIEDSSGREVWHISAGTAVSSRTREEVNSFHLLHIKDRNLQIETFELHEDGFVSRQSPCRISQKK